MPISTRHQSMQQNWDKVWDLFHRLSELAADQQAAALEGVSDRTLAREVGALLAAHGKPAPILAQDPQAWIGELEPMTPQAMVEDLALAAGEHVGAYRIEKLIASGGMGRVYLAERREPFRQRVAIKTLRWRDDPEQFAERLRRERQLLAELEHPGISTLIGGGSTAAGTPYLVLGYIDGVPIDRYCQQAGLPPGKLIDLFLQLCEAVQFAHQRFIVHRDIKPANILVGVDGRPVLLDFGVAKLLDGAPRSDLTEGFIQAPLSPDYASPEQLCGDPVTTATDVYALSVLLYRLLSGELPFRLADKPITEQVDLIRRQAPPPLPRMLGLRVQTDLTRILQRGMAKETDARYPTVAALAADLRRYQDGRPVHARPLTTGYRLRRFVQRHRSATVATVVAALVGLGLMGLWVHASLQARQALRLASANLVRAQQANSFLQGVLTRADVWQPEPGAAPASGLALLDVLNQAAWHLRRHPDLDTTVQKSLFSVLMRAYMGQGEMTRAGELRELAEQRNLVDGDARDGADYALRLAVAQLWLARHENARALADFTRLVSRCTHPEDDCLGARIGRARAHFALGHGQRAVTALEHLLKGAQQPSRRAEIATVLGALLLTRGNLEAAGQHLREAWRLQRKLFGPLHPQSLRSEAHLALALARGAHPAMAKPLYAELITPLSQALGDAHPEVLNALAHYAHLQQRLGNTARARQLYQTLLQRQQSRFGDSAAATVRTRAILKSI